MITKKKMARTPRSLIRRKRRAGRKSNLPHRRRPFVPKVPIAAKLFSLQPYISPPPPAPVRQSNSDSDSEYGSRTKKKKRARSSGDEIRVSSRGGKIPNYIDDVQDFGQFDDDETDSAYYVDPQTHYKEEDEIEAVLNHTREEGRENDGEDLWFDNIVCETVHVCS